MKNMKRILGLLFLASSLFAEEYVTTRGINDDRFPQPYPESGSFTWQGKTFDWALKLKGTGATWGPEENFAPRITNNDKAKAQIGQWYFYDIDQDGYLDDPYYIGKNDIINAQKWVSENTMKGMVAQLPDVDDSGEVFQEYRKNEDYTRKVYQTPDERIEDVITDSAAFTEQFKKLRDSTYTEVIPRNNDHLVGDETGMYRTNDVPASFPKAFWAAIILEGRIMKVYIANGNLQYGIQVGYYCTPDFKQQYPNARWAWAGVDDPVIGGGANPGNAEIMEDIRSSSVLEFNKKE